MFEVASSVKLTAASPEAEIVTISPLVNYKVVESPELYVTLLMVAEPLVKVPLIGPYPSTVQEAVILNPKGLEKDLDSPGVRVMVSDKDPVALTFSSKLAVQSKVIVSEA
jgi:hypothetical protein